MTTIAERTVRALRDEVIHAHQLALDSGNLGRMTTRLYKTSSTIGNYYAQRFNGVYYPGETARYIRAQARGQLANPLMEGTGSATQSMHFAGREFARQNPGRNWVFVWRHYPSARSRPTHVDASGMTVPAGADFGIIPPMGSPHCGCIAELQELKPVLQERLPKPRNVRVQGSRGNFTRGELDDIAQKANQVDDLIRQRLGPDATSRWTGEIRISPNGSTMDWNGVMHLDADAMRALLNGDPEGWHTLLHELSHAYSSTTGAQYNYVNASGYVSRSWIEEAASEGFSRTSLERLGMRAFDAGSDYNEYISWLEKVRLAAGADSQYAFYGRIEAMTFEQRVEFLSRYVNVDSPGNLGLYAPGTAQALRVEGMLANTVEEVNDLLPRMQAYLATHPNDHSMRDSIEHMAHVVEAAEHASAHGGAEHAGNVRHGE